ncbi:hypothetical protein MD484_g7456, partial [Candolleomyces efflorescens]
MQQNRVVDARLQPQMRGTSSGSDSSFNKGAGGGGGTTGEVDLRGEDGDLDEDEDDDERVREGEGSEVADLRARFLGGGISPSSAAVLAVLGLSVSFGPLSPLPTAITSASTLPFPFDDDEECEDALGNATTPVLEEDEDEDRFLRWLLVFPLPLGDDDDDDETIRVGIIEHLSSACGLERVRGAFGVDVVVSAAVLVLPSDPLPFPISPPFPFPSCSCSCTTWGTSSSADTASNNEGGDEGALLEAADAADTLARETAHDARRDLREKMFMASNSIITIRVETSGYRYKFNYH